MKSSVIVALIVVGGVVVVTPLFVEYLLVANHQDNVTRILEKGANRVTLHREEIGEMTSFGCWFTGSVMAFSGVVLAFRAGRPSVGQESEMPVTANHH